ncbi:hypothetical protein HJC23_003594 [Cyclotella cryptica]|uniref:Cytosine-specific methyltransferase n=1 Tax=Cyclotella cryptica TaxID=29204 RepID=A0ABD3QIJ6_9STRA|eukprot:CCRYP_004874-RA/>CCRYP_004874-RA protein AED:0.42 eAED:0.42 QI:0/-1/0/1/-1/1/1/0/693
MPIITSPQISFRSYLADLNSTTNCCRSASLLLPTACLASSQSARPSTEANEVLQRLRQWNWLCESVLVQPWQPIAGKAKISEEDGRHFQCIPSDYDLAFLRSKFSQASLPSTRPELVRFHLVHKSILVPLTDDATAFMLRVLFEEPYLSEYLPTSPPINDHPDSASDSLLSNPTIYEQAFTIQNWLCHRRITLVHNLDGNQTHSFSKEQDSFPSTKPESLPADQSFTFADLFAGIGGFRLGMEALGGKCIGSCEIDPNARQTYHCNFSTDHEFFVTDIARLDISYGTVDVLCGGFPCQSFSTLAGCYPPRSEISCESIGQRSGKCRRGGLHTPSKGKLFFQLLRILRKSQPKLFIFENVKGLVNLDGGSHFKKILDLLTESGYNVTHGIVDTSWILPQRRERVFFVGVRLDLLDDPQANFVAFKSVDLKQKYQIYGNDIVEEGNLDKFDRILLQNGYCDQLGSQKLSKLSPSRLGDVLESDQTVLAESSNTFLTHHQWKKITAQKYIQIHSDGSGQLVTEDDSCAQTLVSSYRQSYLMHSQFVVPRHSIYIRLQRERLLREAQKRRGEVYNVHVGDHRYVAAAASALDGETLPRFFTPRECCRLQGFPEHFILPFDPRCNKMSCFYRQIGNSVSPPCVIAVAEDVVNTFLKGRSDQHSTHSGLCSVFQAVLRASPCPSKVLEYIDKKEITSTK